MTLLLLWTGGHPDLGLLLGVLWGIAALGSAFNVVAFRTLFYLPTFTAGVALMILWKALYNPQTGPIDVGLAALFHFLGLASRAAGVAGECRLGQARSDRHGRLDQHRRHEHAALPGRPLQCAAGAARRRRSGRRRTAGADFRHVTWPQLAPTTFFITIMAIIGGLQGGFEQARVMTAGGPAGSTTTLSYYIYNKAFQDLDMGYAAAISWVLFAIVFVATALNWKFGRGLEVD